MKKLLPLVLLFVGAGAGVGAGIFLRPDAPIETTHAAAEGEEVKAETEKSSHEDHDAHDEAAKHDEVYSSAFVKLGNQFVIPIVAGEKVTALVVLALSIEVPEGEQDGVYQREPKLRDSFLQILFDHANIGGFDGNFTDATVLGRLRTALLEVAQKDLGKAVAKDVLIVEIARQDY